MANTPSLSSPLSRYFTQRPAAGKPLSPATYVAEGAAKVEPGDLAHLHSLLPALRTKIATKTDSARLRGRLDVLAHFIAEATDASDAVAVREAVFVLLYFLKGYDLVPDDIPEVGLVDDALLVETVITRNQHALRAHWASHGRTWPENL